MASLLLAGLAEGAELVLGIVTLAAWAWATSAPRSDGAASTTGMAMANRRHAGTHLRALHRASPRSIIHGKDWASQRKA